MITGTPAFFDGPHGVQRLAPLARAVAGTLGGRVGVAPRLFLKKLVGDVLGRVDQHDEFDPRQHYSLTVRSVELTDVERSGSP